MALHRSSLLIWLLAALADLSRDAAAQTPPESPYCKWSPQHTLCRFQGTVGDDCQTLTVRGVDDRARQSILQAHNSLRSLVASGSENQGSPGPQPPASNMQILTWDAELEKVAQAWADQCTFEHDCNQCRRVDRFPVGQNLALETTSGPARPANWKKMITNWYQEVQLFPNTTVRNYQFDPATGHYSALIWAETNRVGCGFTTYRRDGLNVNLYVCDYGPSGNFIGLPVYKTGKGCTQCPTNSICSSQFPNLCEPTKKPIEPITSVNTIPGSDPGDQLPALPASLNEIDPLPAARPSSAVTTRRPASVVTSVSPAPPAKTSTALPAASDTAFTCSVGRGVCRASYVGSPWGFRRDLTGQEFLETTVAANNSTELRIGHLFRAPSADQICLSLRLRESLERSDPNPLQNTVPASVLLIKPQSGPHITIQLQTARRNRWIHIRLTVAGLHQPFQLSLQKGAPAISAVNALPVSVRLALHTITVNDGPCV